MTETTPEDAALGQAVALIGQELRRAEARCTVLGQYIDDCESQGSKTPAWSEALRELHALHGYRIRLLRRRSLIQQALDYSIGERPVRAPLPAPPSRPVRRTQQQIQIQATRRR
jgi:hypothetical protein